MGIRNLTLSNGLKVVVNSQPSFQTVGVAVGVKYGSVDEDLRVSGAAHYLEHMLFKGTRRRTWKDIMEEARNFGMVQNAFTNKETTVYFLGVYKDYFERAVDLLSDMIRNSVFSKKEFELERGPIINENLIRYDTPYFFFYDFMPRALYKKHKASMPVCGNEETINRTRLEDITEPYSRYYSPKNMVVSIYGSLSADRALDSVRKHFGGFEKRYNKQQREPARERQELKELTVMKRGIKQTRLGIGFKSAGFCDSGIEEYVTMLVVADILSRRVYDEVRERRGLSYDPSASYSMYNTFGFISAAAGVEPSKLGDAKEVMLNEFEKMQNGEVDRSELEKRKEGLSVRYAIGKENTLNFALDTANAHMVFGDATIPMRLPELVRRVTLDDVRKYSSKYIYADRYGMIVLKPKG